MNNHTFPASLLVAATLLFSTLAASSCRGRSAQPAPAAVDTLSQAEAMTLMPEPDTVAVEEISIDNLDLELEKPEYAGGILPDIAKASRSYARKILENPDNKRGFLIVDKRRMKVLLYDRYGHKLLSYGMACARNYGTKHKKADSRTPEGYFTILGIFDSTDWLFTNDEGYTSPAKGSFGPRFIRLSVPQIGIHGTSAPWSIGRRASHGCIRVTNENIMELVEYVDKGMSVIILPSPKDQAVNRSEGYDVVSFLTSPLREKDKEEEERMLRQLEADTASAAVDSIAPADSIAPGVPADTLAIPEEPGQPAALPDTI